MIHFFKANNNIYFALQIIKSLKEEDIEKLNWLFGQSTLIENSEIPGFFVGPRSTMITPWSTNAVEITQNMTVPGVLRIEKYTQVKKGYKDYDSMLEVYYEGLGQDIFEVNSSPQAIIHIDDIKAYNISEGLSLNSEEVQYLEDLAKKLGRKLTDSEVFGFSQVNSEHCRHKIFNGTFLIDGEEKSQSLFKLIKETSKQHPNTIVSAYKDNVAFVKGPKIEQFAPRTPDKPDYYEVSMVDSVLSLKAETHNFPTTVEPFNGAATGSGGEIRDRLAGGKGSLPLAGTAVYMTAYSRLKNDRPWENKMAARDWLYQSPIDILIKASNGASDFGNKFGQPLISGSLLTFEYKEATRRLGYDKVIMQAGGIGYGVSSDSLKDTPVKDDKIVVMGGDNYRIGMGGAAVSSADTGVFSNAIELNAVQRSNPEMQKRVANAIRAMVETGLNPIVSIHDHGAGGHLNCLSELVEDTGGVINLDKLPIGDPTLSAKEILGNESQERMGLVINHKDLDYLKRVAERERAPIYVVGEVTNDQHFSFVSDKYPVKPMDFKLADMFGSSPKTVMIDNTVTRDYPSLTYNINDIHKYIENVLKLEAVACKDWLTNKVDRCVSGKVAKQQCVGSLQLPLNDCGVMALDYRNMDGLATSVGHAPISALLDPVAGSKNAIAESLTNIVWAPMKDNLKSISLSANWMWPCRNEGEDARLYKAVEAVSEFSIALGINVPTGKDSLSMKQKYNDGDVLSPGTVIISAAGHCSDISRVVEPVFQHGEASIFYIDMSSDKFKLGGSSFAQSLGEIGDETPTIIDEELFGNAFNTIQYLIKQDKIVAGHDISAGGLLTCLLEMCFAENDLGADIDISKFDEKDIIKILFSENSGVVIQTNDDRSVKDVLNGKNIPFFKIGKVTNIDKLNIKKDDDNLSFDISEMRDKWYETSYLLDQKQTANGLAEERYKNYKNQPLNFSFPKHFTGELPVLNANKPRPKAAIIREKGSNSEREMANAMYMAGFDVKDVHMTDLISGRETLEDIQFIGAVGGFSNSDVLGSAKGWAGAFKYNAKAKQTLENFFARPDTMSVGICNGCQLFIELGLINPEHDKKPKMLHNDSGKHESIFTSVDVLENDSIMLNTLAGANLGVWVSHGEGKFSFPYDESKYHISAKYTYDKYPANPNGSDYNVAMMHSSDGRHLVMMPHIERSTFVWNWANYPKGRNDKVSPWLEAFVNARKWVVDNG